MDKDDLSGRRDLQFHRAFCELCNELCNQSDEHQTEENLKNFYREWYDQFDVQYGVFQRVVGETMSIQSLRKRS